MPLKFPTPIELTRGKCRRPLMISLMLTAIAIVVMAVSVGIITGNFRAGLATLIGSSLLTLISLAVGLYILGFLCVNNYSKTVNLFLIVKGLAVSAGVVAQLVAVSVSLRRGGDGSKEGFCGACSMALAAL